MGSVLRTNGLLVAGAALSTAITPDARAALANDSLLGFLAFLTLLLLLALIAIVRFEQPERESVEDEPADAATPAAPYWPSGYPTPPPGQRHVAAPQPGQRRAAPLLQPGQRRLGQATQPRQRPVAPVPLPVRVPGQQAGYTARHGPGAAPSQSTSDRPRVSGGPPWGPAPRPPGMDPFLRSSE
jgi:hypothetical protein